MDVEIYEEPPADNEEYAGVSIAFYVDRVLELAIQDSGIGGMTFHERCLTSPYLKDYDSILGNHPKDWATRFDVSNWGSLSARIAGQRVGGVVIAFKTEGLDMLERRDDLAVIWDLRVAPEMRRRRVATALLAAAERWCEAKGCSRITVETQNINLAACKFYANRGFQLGSIDRIAYPDLPDEIQFIWYKELAL